jgi:chromosome segregation ATPase
MLRGKGEVGSVDLMSDMTQDVSGAEAKVEEARATLEEARSATHAAETVYRERQAEEETRLTAYEEAIAAARDLYATRRERLEEQKRRAEEELRALESKLEGLKAGNEVRIEPVKVDLSTKVVNGSAEGAGSNGEATEALEDDWYQKLLLEASTETIPTDGGE